MSPTQETIIRKENESMSPRIKRMLERFYFTRPSVCIDRDILYAESYRENPRDCEEIRRAKAFRHVMDTIPVIIPDGDLIVGTPNPKLRATAVYPELGAEWLKKDIETFNTRERAHRPELRLAACEGHWRRQERRRGKAGDA